MSERVVLLGTGTGVGKTYMGSCLARALRVQGGALALKPVETGLERDGRGDWASLEAASGNPVPIPLPHPRYVFESPVSPHLAARQLGTSIRLDAIAEWVAAVERAAPQRWTVVETAGGALSPLGPRSDNVDLALALLPATLVLVGADCLGAIHQMRATSAAMQLRGVAADLFVLSQATLRDASTGTNAAELERFDIPIAECITRGATQLTRLPRLLEKHVQQKTRQPASHRSP